MSIRVPIQLRDGTEVHLHAMRGDDAAALLRFHHQLSPETTYLRFFSVHPELSARELEYFTHVDHQNREAIVATVDDMIIGIARFDRIDETNDAEAAFVIADAWQGEGLGTALFHRLAERAREVGIDRFVAEVLPHNRRMLDISPCRAPGDELPSRRRCPRRGRSPGGRSWLATSMVGSVRRSRSTGSRSAPARTPVRLNGIVYEAVTAAIEPRARCDLYDSVLEVAVPSGRYMVEMTPEPDRRGEERGVVAESPVGLRARGAFGSSATRCAAGVTESCPTWASLLKVR